MVQVYVVLLYEVDITIINSLAMQRHGDMEGYVQA